MFRSTQLGLLVGSLLVTLPVMAQQDSDPTTDLAAELTKLQTQRVATLKQLAELQFAMYRSGECFVHEVLTAQHDLFEAQLEMAETPAQRIALLESQVKMAKQTLDAAENLCAVGQVSRCDPLRAKAALLGVEIKLLQELARAEPPPK
jgi:outer membrane protein TolC